ncbi:MAG: hypothetical protein LUC37_02225 [Prevotella sp.]|nr:hypothetical protein [Prevotella sp.]
MLKSTAILDPTKVDVYGDYGAGASKIFGATYEVELPLDYLHMLNCICIYKLKENYKCYNKGDNVQFAAKRLTADTWSVISMDYYTRPLPERPYYYIHNVNTQTNVSTNPYDGESTLPNAEGTDVNNEEGYTYKIDSTTKEGTGKSNLPRKIKIEDLIGGSKEVSTVNSEKDSSYRYGNPSKIRCEIRYGQDDSVFKLKKVMIDYLKVPQYIRLTQEQVNLTKDTSAIMEFPDYVCQEIINELKMIVQENSADPRLQTSLAVSQSIGQPAQQ